MAARPAAGRAASGDTPHTPDAGSRSQCPRSGRAPRAGSGASARPAACRASAARMAPRPRRRTRARCRPGPEPTSLSGASSISDLQSLVLEVELALEPVHDVVGDHALVAQPHDLAPLGLEDLPHRRLVGDRAVLVAVVLDLAGAGGEPVLAVAVQ